MIGSVQFRDENFHEGIIQASNERLNSFFKLTIRVAAVEIISGEQDISQFGKFTETVIHFSFGSSFGELAFFRAWKSRKNLQCYRSKSNSIGWY